MLRIASVMMKSQLKTRQKNSLKSWLSYLLHLAASLQLQISSPFFDSHTHPAGLGRGLDRNKEEGQSFAGAENFETLPCCSTK